MQMRKRKVGTWSYGPFIISYLDDGRLGIFRYGKLIEATKTLGAAHDLIDSWNR